MDKIQSSGQLEKTQLEVQKAVGSAVVIEVNLQGLAALQDPEQKYAAEWISGSGYHNTMRLGFADLCKVASGKAWLSRIQKIMVSIIPAQQQNSDVAVVAQVQEPMMQLTFTLRTTHSLRSSYNQRALEDAVEAAIPQLKTGKDMDKITASGQLDKTLAEVQKSIGSTVAINFDLFSISNMPPQDCQFASEWVAGSGYHNTMRLAFQDLCKVASGKAWLSRIQQIKVTVLSAAQQTSDVAVVATVQEPVMQLTFSLRTTHSLRSSYNQRALADAICQAIPQLKTGQDMDKITSAGTLEKTQQEVQKAIGSNVVIEFDLFSICNMPEKECHFATEWVTGSGYANTMRLGFADLTKVGSGKAWLQRIQKINITAVSAAQQNSDVAVVATLQEPVMQLTFSLRTTHSLRSSYNQRALNDAVCLAIPQLKAGQDMDKITSSGQLDKTQAEVQKAVGAPVMIDFDLYSICNLPAEQCHFATEWVAGSGYFNTMRLGFVDLGKKSAFPQFMSQFQKIHVVCISAPQQNTDVAVQAGCQQPGVLSIHFSLRTTHSLRSSYNQRALVDAMVAICPQLK